MDTVQSILTDIPKEIPTDNTRGRPLAYSPKIAYDILLDVATTSDNIDAITKRYGTTKPTFYHWLMLNEQFLNCYQRALENRAHVMGADYMQELQDLDDYVTKSPDDPREKHARIQVKRAKYQFGQWLMSKYNRSMYGDKLDVAQTITIEPQQLRTTAWEEIQAEQASVDNSPASG